MYRYIVYGLMSLFMLFGFSSVQAQPSIENAFFADQMPTGADIFIGIRTDEAYLDQINEVVRTIMNGIIAINPSTDAQLGDMNVYQVLNLLITRPLQQDDFQTSIRPWLGDGIAMGMYWNRDSIRGSIFIIDITDRELAEAFMENLLRGTVQTSVEGNFTLYSNPSAGFIAGINDDALYLTSEYDLLPINGAPADSLAMDAQFQNALNSLPLPSYNILVIGETPYLISLLDNQSPNRQIIQMGFGGNITVIGATIQDDTSPTIDIAQIGFGNDIAEFLGTPLNPAFTQYIPADATGVIHGTNLLPLFNGLVTTFSQISGTNILGQVNEINRFLGVNLPELLLTGDFAIYFTYSPEGIASYITNSQNATTNTPTSMLSIEELREFLFSGEGIIIAHDDRAQAETLLNSLFRLLSTLPANLFNVTREQIGVSNTMVISIPLNDDTLAPIEVVFGVTDDILLIAERNSATQILMGNSGFDANPIYKNAMQYALPNATHAWFVDQNFAGMLVNYLALFYTPAVFDERLDNQTLGYIQSLQPNISAFSELFDSATLTTSVDGDIFRIRAVLSLSE
ncbi:MAG: DUF3352 domain-containing protein [Anaerolineae bacterium]|jgi:hypothetical protein|nr:DUF3352 domain-containing protein [Anaerolineae bacterium]